MPKATPYPAGDPELYSAIWRGSISNEELQALVNRRKRRSTPATTKVIRSYIPRFGGPLLKKCGSWLQPVRM